jgi:hypothetical protein
MHVEEILEENLAARVRTRHLRESARAVEPNRGVPEIAKRLEIPARPASEVEDRVGPVSREVPKQSGDVLTDVVAPRSVPERFGLLAVMAEGLGADALSLDGGELPECGQPPLFDTCRGGVGEERDDRSGERQDVVERFTIDADDGRRALTSLRLERGEDASLFHVNGDCAERAAFAPLSQCVEKRRCGMEGSGRVDAAEVYAREVAGVDGVAVIVVAQGDVAVVVEQPELEQP